MLACPRRTRALRITRTATGQPGIHSRWPIAPGATDLHWQKTNHARLGRDSPRSRMQLIEGLFPQKDTARRKANRLKERRSWPEVTADSLFPSYTYSFALLQRCRSCSLRNWLRPLKHRPSQLHPHDQLPHRHQLQRLTRNQRPSEFCTRHCLAYGHCSLPVRPLFTWIVVSLAILTSHALFLRLVPSLCPLTSIS